jgi:formylglycine-generating enzyme required for sulfatase activity
LGNDNDLVDSLHFWQRRLLQDEKEQRLHVGVLSGFSGVGKTSFVEAGLLPLVEDEFEMVKVSADSSDLEETVAEKLGLTCWSEESLDSLISKLRPKPILLVIDQFESWLVKNRNPNHRSKIVRLLKSLDGNSLKVLLVVRNEWAESLSKLVKASKKFAPNYEARSVDRLDVDSAVEVLAELGRAYGCLGTSISESNRKFLSSAVKAIREDEAVQPMRLSLFAYLNRKQKWEGFVKVEFVTHLTTLFLQRYCGPRADDVRIAGQSRAVKHLLYSLLPNDDVDLKDSGKTVTQLQQGLKGVGAIGVRDLLRSLEGLYLVRQKQEGNTERFQLTHDFWITAIKSWRESLAEVDVGGKAVLALRRQQKVWLRNNRMKRHLLSLKETADVLLTTSSRNADSVYHDFFMCSLKHHLRRAAFYIVPFVAILFVFVWFWSQEKRRRADEWVTHAQSVPLEILPDLISASPPGDDVADLAGQMLRNDPRNLTLKVLAAAENDELAESIFSELSELPFKNRVLLEYLLHGNTAIQGHSDNVVVLAFDVASGQTTFVDALNKVKKLSDKYMLTHLSVSLGLGTVSVVDELSDSWHSDNTYFLLTAIYENAKSGLDESTKQKVVSCLSENASSAFDVGVSSVVKLLCNELDIPFMGYNNGSQIEVPSAQAISMLPVVSRDTHELGSPRSESERQPLEEDSDVDFEAQYLVKQDYDFEVSATEVTVEQFLSFVDENNYGDKFRYKPAFSCSDQHPVNRVSWHDAAAFCNWLSEKNGIGEDQWCFNVTWTVNGPKATLKQNCLTLVGFRLPSATEFEIAARGGNPDARFFGATPELLSKYSCNPFTNDQNSMLQVGSLLPNRFGLFDMLGNTNEWTLFPKTEFSSNDLMMLSDESWQNSSGLLHETRGGSFYNFPRYHRSSYRMFYKPDTNLTTSGFRVVRTCVEAENLQSAVPLNSVTFSTGSDCL